MVEDLSDSHARELALTEALAHVPGYSPGDPSIQISQLRGGSFNHSYRVSSPAGQFVLRLSQAPDAWLATDRSAERSLHQIAAKAGIAPPIVHATERWLITEYISGRLWTPADFARPECLALLGRTLLRLHSLPVPEQSCVDLLHILRGYSDRIGAAAEGLQGYLDSAAAAWRVCEGNARPAAVVHHDLHASNLVDARQGLVLIDWECAAVAEPLLDVACILSYHESARPHARLLLQQSGLEAVTPRQLAASVWLFDLHTYLWYRERRLRLTPTGPELEAERALSVRLPATREDWRQGP
jgi:thiamine kinase